MKLSVIFIPLLFLVCGPTGEIDISGMISKYMAEIEDLRTKLCQSENLCEQLRKENTKVCKLYFSI